MTLPVEREVPLIVVGGGHAGLEAAWAATALGVETVLLTLDREAIGRMSCNPAIGGLGKGHLVVELDALGGLMPLLADQTGIQFRILNRSRGPAVQAPRAQSDKAAYARAAQSALAARPHLEICTGMVTGLWVEAGILRGLEIDQRARWACRAAVLTTGTFLNGRIHEGQCSWEGGRIGEPAAVGLSESLALFHHPMGRLKTGTPPRVDGRTVDWTALEAQPGDDPPRPFSLATDRLPLPQVPCHLTHTTGKTHALVRENLHLTARYGGSSQATGPRYCPSIEDKVVKFPHHERHTLFVEPEGLETDEIYLNGLSTSLPAPLQEGLIQTLPGFTEAVMVRAGYAIEYDHVDPRALGLDLQSRAVPGLFLAGQINGTTGYEEAAALGFVAGVNAAHRILGRGLFHVERHRGYLGVLVEDLVTRGVTEPYRMFTSRSEHRLLLGTDTAYARLSDTGRALGTLDPVRDARAREQERCFADALRAARGRRVTPDAPGAGLAPPGDPSRGAPVLADLLRRHDLAEAATLALLPDIPPALALRVRNTLRYEGYVARARQDAERLAAAASQPIPTGFPFRRIPGLRPEVAEQLEQHRPATLGLAGRLPGVTPAACAILAAYLARPALLDTRS